MGFVLSLRRASLTDLLAQICEDALVRLRDPPRAPIDIDHPGIRHSISMYLALEHASQDAYNRIRRSTLRNLTGAEGANEILSFHTVERHGMGLPRCCSRWRYQAK